MLIHVQYHFHEGVECYLGDGTCNWLFNWSSTIIVFITQGAFEQLDFHLPIALNVRLKQEEILEIVLQCAAYFGNPSNSGIVTKA